MPENQLANAAITDMQMRQRDAAALDAKYTKELADAKAENDAPAWWCHWSSSVASKQSVSRAWSHHAASGVDNAASPRLADTAERIISPQREADHYAKNNWKEPRSILMSSVDRVAHIDGQLMQLLWAHTRFQQV